MPPAARLGDIHICPMFDGPKPHVGGPISGPGEPSVLIGGQPAALVGDMATCAGPPDTIAKGSPTVLVGGKRVARLGDTTAHGGWIVSACPTVIIGDSGSGGSGGRFGPIQASVGRTPTEGELAEIQSALDAGYNQHAVDLTIEYFEIDTGDVTGGVRYDSDLHAYGETVIRGAVRVGRPAMSSVSTLATTIVHETTHANQAVALRANDPSLHGFPKSTYDYDEAVAYDAELSSSHRTGLLNDAGEMELVAKKRATFLRGLSAEESRLFEHGGYPP